MFRDIWLASCYRVLSFGGVIDLYRIWLIYSTFFANHQVREVTENLEREQIASGIITNLISIGFYMNNLSIQNADVVLICGGAYILPPYCNMLDRDLFYQNMPFVRSAALACAEFAQHAIVAVQTPPVDANLTLVKYVSFCNLCVVKNKNVGIIY